MKHANVNIILKQGTWLVRVNESYNSHLVSYSEHFHTILGVRQFYNEKFTDHASVYCNLMEGANTIRLSSDDDWAMAILTYSK